MRQHSPFALRRDRSEAEPETLGNRDELDRFSACPVTLTQAAYVAAVDPRDTAGRL